MPQGRCDRVGDQDDTLHATVIIALDSQNAHEQYMIARPLTGPGLGYPCLRFRSGSANDKGFCDRASDLATKPGLTR